MNIEFEGLFKDALQKGINLFLGAGFSIYAKNKNNKTLPLSKVLANELSIKFDTPKFDDLGKICTVIDKKDRIGLKRYLKERFDVDIYPDFYNNIKKIKCERIFTTNIDNLLSKIYNDNSKKYLNDVFVNGPCFNDRNCIDYYPLHGSIEKDSEQFIFSIKDLAISFDLQKNGWVSLSNSVNQIPSLFIGYSLNDVAAIEALFSDNQFSDFQQPVWIALHKEKKDEIAYFKALNFNIIIADTKELLEYFNVISLKENYAQKEKDYLGELYPQAKIPKTNRKESVRNIEKFFLGNSPIWSDIIANRIHKTSHFNIILDKVFQEKNLVVYGIPASGKTTLLMQVAYQLDKTKRVFVFENLSMHQSSIIANEVKSKTFIFIDNFTNDINAFINLTKNKYIKLIGFDRYYNIDISSHKLNNRLFYFYDVSDLTEQDIQGIYEKIPLSIRKNRLKTKDNKSDIPSIFEIVNYNINKTEISERYSSILNELYDDNPLLAELLILSSYLHSCRVPVSFEVANAYLSDDISSYSDVLDYMDALQGLVNEVLDNVIDEYNDQDYYQPRSQILADTIIEQTKNYMFKIVYKKFHANVPKHVIPSYSVFKRKAYDAYYTTKAFSNWAEGKLFYEDIYRRDKTPFVLQQAALYLLKKKRYKEAAVKIDIALQISKKRFFSIENTHAIILFRANIDSFSTASHIKNTLDSSMDILKKCYMEDQRKTYHAMTFAEQAIEYYSRFPDDKSKGYLDLALKWLKEIQTERKNYFRVKKLIKDIEMIK